MKSQPYPMGIRSLRRWPSSGAAGLSCGQHALCASKFACTLAITDCCGLGQLCVRLPRSYDSGCVPRGPLLWECSLPSSLLRPHVPIPLPLANFACRLVGESLPLRPPAAGQGTFPTLHLRIFHWMPRPLPRWLQRCSFPFLPFGLRPCPEFTAGRRLTMFRAATSARGRISGLQTFRYVEASSFASHPGRSHRYGEFQVLPLLLP